jgi:hypothetical protein
VILSVKSRTFPDKRSGGEGGIRTPDTRQGMSAFEADRFNHSRTSPRRTAILFRIPATDKTAADLSLPAKDERPRTNDDL